MEIERQMDACRTDSPQLGKDRSFWGVTATQFLGAFNDNVFKQMLLLICVGQFGQESDSLQSIAAALFASAFVLFSGFSGYLSDRLGKRGLIVACKVAEIFIMGAGMLAFFFGSIGELTLIYLLFGVLFLMGVQSAVFGPSKYGILPELFRDSDLPKANGIIQMTTFLAIIFGTASAGFLKQNVGDHLWIVSAVCVGIAILGTLTSLFIRRTPAATPSLKFSADCLLVEKTTWRYLLSDRNLQLVIFAYTLFWFVGAVVMLLVNNVCRNQLFYREDTTSCMTACIGLGIAIGCLTCGRLSGKKIRFDLVRIGAVGVCGALCLVALICLVAPEPIAGDPASPEKLQLPFQAELFHAVFNGIGLMSMGLFAGLFAVPLQVYIQTRPPESMKGRVIAASALITWIGILFASAYYWLLTYLFSIGALNWAFVVTGALIGVVPIFFRLPNASASESHVST